MIDGIPRLMFDVEYLNQRQLLKPTNVLFYNLPQDVLNSRMNSKEESQDQNTLEK